MSKAFGLALVVLAVAIGGVQAMTLTVGNTNMMELLGQSNDIVVGRVLSVTDGIDERGIEYTEVTLNVSEAIRGGLSGTYTFRQFGLLAPRLTAGGSRKLMPAPVGFPKYTAGEELVLFMHPSAAWTGFRMPAGVTLGKFVLGPGRVENDAHNAGLFDDVRLEKGLATAEEKRMMAVGGAANPDTFLSFVRRAVHERWVETGRMSHADGRRGPQTMPRSEADSSRGQAHEPPASNPLTAPLDPTTNSALPGSPR
jgi:hypothetical protein